MTQIADQFKQKVRGLVGYQAAMSSNPSSNRMDGSVHASNSYSEISVISKPAMLHDKGLSASPSESCISPSSCKLNPEELQMLAKIEEQNRLLAADRKSLKSVSSEGPTGTSRRSSNGSVSPTSISVHSATFGCNDMTNNVGGNVPEYSDKTWNYWGRIVNDWEEQSKKNGKQLKEIIRCGIPHHFRGLVWQLLCKAHNSPHKVEYRNLLKQTSPSEKLIRRDIARTYPEQDFFKEKDGGGQEVLFNVIKAYSLLDREVGYCQGSAFIVGLLLMQMPEEESFAVFVALMREYRLRELYKPSMAELGLCMYQFENMLQDHAPELLTHFQAQAFHTSMFASSWFLTLFATFFNLSLASRILDVFLSEGMEIIFRIGIALLLNSKTKLLSLDMEGMLKLIQKELSEYYNKEPDMLFQKAYALVRYNGKKMKKSSTTMGPKPLLHRGPVQCKHYFHGPAFKVWQMNTTKLNNTTGIVIKEHDSFAKSLSEISQMPLGLLTGYGPVVVEAVDNRLEKEYMSMKEREQEEQIEMKRLRTESRLLRQRIDTLEKENASLADKLIQDRVNRALEAEEKIIMGKQLSIAKRKAMQVQNNSASFTDGDSPNSANSDSVKPNNGRSNEQPYYVHIQQELVESKIREAEAASRIVCLQDKICDLQERNRELTDQSRVTSLQEELIVTKLREAEACTAMKELAHKIRLLEDNWQKHLSRTSASRRSSMHNKSNHSSKVALQELQEELMSAKVRETKLISQNADTKQKLMELETTNHICTSQLRRSEEDRCNLKERLRVCSDNERVLKEEISDGKTRIAHVESKNQEALMTLRLKEADNAMKMAELKQDLSNLKLKKVETTPLVHSSIIPNSSSKDSTEIIHQLQTKILKQQRDLDRLRRQMSSDGGVVLSDTDSASDFGDDLLLDATLTADVLHDLSSHDGHLPADTPEVPDSASCESAE